MFLLNLSLPEFLALFAAVSGVVVTLYLLSRARRRQRVATLQFWTRAVQPVPSMRRRRIQHPWSLLLQLLSLFLLLLALAQLKLGDRERASRDHVLLLDASSWAGARAGDTETVLDRELREARRWLRSLPSSDRVMVVRVEALPSPATGMEADRALIERAMDETRPGASALDLDAALAFAVKARQLHGSSHGEIVYAGPGRTGAYGAPTEVPANFRLLPVEAPAANVGLTGIGVRRSEAQAGNWEVLVTLRNYGTESRRVPLTLTFGGAAAGGTVVDLAPGATADRTFPLRTRAAGWLDARILVRDGLDEDNRALLEVPKLEVLRVDVWSDDPASIEPLLATHPEVQASIQPTRAYRANPAANVVIFDRFAPPADPQKTPALYIEPPDTSIFRSRTRTGEAALVEWRGQHEISAGIRSRDLRLSNAQVLASAAGDVSFAGVAGGPVGLARPGRRAVALGFHPGRGDLRFDLTSPLLMANTLRWLAPQAFGASEVHARSVGAVTVALGRNTDPRSVRVLADSQQLPFTAQDGSIRFYAGSPGVVRVLADGRENVFSLSLPEVAERTWTVPPNVKQGIPGLASGVFSRDVWQILAILGATGLAVEWLLFARRRVAPTESMPPARLRLWRKAS